MKSILPDELHEEIPSGFNTVGHVGMLLTHQTTSVLVNIYAQPISTSVISTYLTRTLSPKYFQTRTLTSKPLSTRSIMSVQRTSSGPLPTKSLVVLMI